MYATPLEIGPQRVAFLDCPWISKPSQSWCLLNSTRILVSLQHVQLGTWTGKRSKRLLGALSMGAAAFDLPTGGALCSGEVRVVAMHAAPASDFPHELPRVPRVFFSIFFC